LDGRGNVHHCSNSNSADFFNGFLRLAEVEHATGIITMNNNKEKIYETLLFFNEPVVNN